MVRFPVLVISTFVSIGLLFLGGLFAFLNITWSVEWEYRVEVTAPDPVAWTLLVPRPNLSMPWTTSGTLAVVGFEDTPYGTRINLTGTGSGRVRFSNSTTFVGLGPRSGIPTLSLFDREGTGSTLFYRVWRNSSNPSANLTVFGALGFTAQSPEEVATCDGSGFVGHPEEGWHALPFRVGECEDRFTRRPGFIPLVLSGFGGVLAGAVVAARRHPPDER